MENSEKRSVSESDIEKVVVDYLKNPDFDDISSPNPHLGLTIFDRHTWIPYFTLYHRVYSSFGVENKGLAEKIPEVIDRMVRDKKILISNKRLQDTPPTWRGPEVPHYTV